jgi:hypothetical protein
MNDNYPPGFNAWELDSDEIDFPEEEINDDDFDPDDPFLDITDEELLGEDEQIIE